MGLYKGLLQRYAGIYFCAEKSFDAREWTVLSNIIVTGKGEVFFENQKLEAVYYGKNECFKINGTNFSGELSFDFGDDSQFHWPGAKVYGLNFTGFKKGTSGPVDVRGVALNGSYEVGIKYGGAYGKWQDYGQLQVLANGDIIFKGVQIKPQIANNRLTWNVSASEGNIEFQINGNTPYYWPEAVDHQCFTGFVNDRTGGNYDFRGLWSNT